MIRLLGIPDARALRHQPQRIARPRWTAPEHAQLTDYSARPWSGLVGGLYRERAGESTVAAARRLLERYAPRTATLSLPAGRRVAKTRAQYLRDRHE